MKKAIANSKKINPHILEKLFLEVSMNNKEAFHEMYELIKGPIYGYSLSILKNHEDALDNTQDVFVKIYESLEKYDYKNKPMNWVFTIAKNNALMKLRKSKRETKEELNEEIISSNIKEEDKIIIKILMEKLTEEERQIIIMHLSGGLKHHEIASLLELKLSTVLSKYHRAIKKLRLEWKEV